MITKGEKIDDRYLIIRSVGEGGMANVYLAHDTILDRDVAIKVLRGDLANDEKFVRRFRREALSASSLSHPAIVEVYDVGEDDGKYYIVMEFIEGKNLKQLIKKRGTLTLGEVIDIMLQLTNGIANAHDSYIIHRDIKPQNIILKENGAIKITDFGIATALNSTQLTQTNSAMGTVYYLPPEQAAGKGSTIRSDIYSMGILLYELLTGTLPFKGDNPVEIALKHIKDPLPNIKRKNPNVPQSLENIILKATAKNPKNRYAGAKEMHEDLLTALNEDRKDEPVHIYKYNEHDTDEAKEVAAAATPRRQAPKKEEPKQNSKFNRLMWILSAVLTFIIVLLAALFLILPELTKVPDVEVPDVSNMKVSEAEEKLKQLGFIIDLNIIKEENDEFEKGTVIKTEPSIGRKIKKGTQITIYESLGAEIYVVEDYIGGNYIEIKTILENIHNLKVVIEKQEVIDPTGDYDKQNIIGQSIKVGTKLAAGDTIILYIPDIEDGYPNMVKEGWSIADVEAFAEKYGIDLVTEDFPTSSYAPGTITYQSRNPGTPIVKGAKLIVRVAVEADIPNPGGPTN